MDVLRHFRNARRIETIPQGTALFSAGDLPEYLVVARTRCRVVPIDPDHFDLLVHETPAFGRHVMRVMAARLRRMNENLDVTQPIGGVNVRVVANTSRSMEQAEERAGRRA